ncbi:MAG: CehA/McbA family metallohydrolase, partial [Pseudobutyrivibrio sp.]|nr:CehA/McbA family metallohydrolase [Pseudobutyrivibrio sp.]
MKKLARRGLAFVLSFLMIVTTAYSDMSLIALADEVHHVWTKVELSQISPNDSIAITMTKDGITYVLSNEKKVTSNPAAIPASIIDANSISIDAGNDSDYVWNITPVYEEKTEVTPAINETEANLTEENKAKLNDADEIKKSDDSENDEKSDVSEVDAKTEALVLDDAENTAPVAETTVSKVLVGLQASGKNGCLYKEKNSTNVAIGDSDTNNVWLLDGNYISVKLADDHYRQLGVVAAKSGDMFFRAYKNAAIGEVNDSIENQTLAFYKLTDKVAGETPAALAAPTASLEDDAAVDFGTQVVLSCATEDAKIYYNVNGSEDNYKLYDAPIEITRDTTIYAKSKLEDSESEVVTFHYTLAEGTKITDLTKVSSEQEFVLVNADTKAMAQTVNNGKIASYDVKLNDDKHLTVDDETAPIAKLKLVKADAEGEYYITSDIIEEGVLVTKYLSAVKTEKSWAIAFSSEKDEYSKWSIETAEDGSFAIKNVNAKFKDKNQYLEIFNGEYTVYSFSDKNKANYAFNAYTFPKVDKPVDVPTENTVAHLLKRELYPGDKVVAYYAPSSKIMTTETITGGFAAADLKPAEDGTIDIKDTKAAVFTVEIDENGDYFLKTDDGKYLSIDVVKNDAGKTYYNLALTDSIVDGSAWLEKAADDKNDGNYYLISKNIKFGTQPQAFEYYSGFKAYGFKEDKAYVFNFYALEEGTKYEKLDFDEDTKLTVVQWGGNANYSEVENSDKYINGDLYDTNDLLDKNAKFTAFAGNAVTEPWKSVTSSQTGSTNYYMGAEGVYTANDYMQFEFKTSGYGDLSLSFRMRASNTAAGAFQLQYSTDGENFKNFKNGSYSYKIGVWDSSINNKVEKKGAGDITDGIAKTSYTPAEYTEFTFEVPAAANNADKVYVRLVPTGTLNAKGDKAPTKSGVIRIDTVKVIGSPVISPDICGFVKANPASSDVALGQEVELTSSTADADIFYSVNGGEFTKYDAEKKLVLSELPATITTYATKEGLKNSITVRHQYTQSQVLPVKANPNGGAIAANQQVKLQTKTEDATILYRYVKDDTEGEWVTYEAPFTPEELPCQIQVKATKEGYKDSETATLKFTKRLNDKYNIYFGQVHAHTNISDGAGSLEEALKHASKVDNLDYIVITDHSNSIDNADASKITENVDTKETDEWTYAHNLSKQYTTEDFTCAYGYEMTWSNGLGHMNTFNTPGFQSRTQKEFSTYGTALQNYYAALRTVPDSISQFNHPGTTFGDFQDFAYYSEENDNLITMIEVGNGEGAIGSSGYFPSYEYYTRALDKGWHVAPTNNQDNHKGKWGDANTARTVMLADVNDENAIYDAMRNYRIYATEDNDLSIYYTLDNYVMGTILEKDAVGETIELKADIKDPTDSSIGNVEVIVNGGRSIASQKVSGNEETVTFNVPSSYSYYYLKITEADGDIAVTAPVWVGEVEACGINKTYTNTVLPVKGEKLDVNVDFYNNEKQELTIDEIDIQLSDVDGKRTPVASLTGEAAGIETVKSNGTATFKTDFVYEGAGKVTYEVTVNATLNGVKKTYTDKLTVDYSVPEMVGDVVIDGTHGNDYVTGYYGGNVNAFVTLCANKKLRATVVKDKITAETLAKAKILVVSAPAKKSGTANAGDYVVSHFDDEFISVVKDYVANGGTVIVCGLADYSDSTDCQTATEQNKLLEAIGATIRMGSDEVVDEKNNGGQVYRMYPRTFNTDADLLAGIKDGQMYSQYSGCSVDISNAKATDFVDEAEWLVKGFDTTYSVDCKDASGNSQGGKLDSGVSGVKLDNDGNVTFLARQKTKAGGQIIVSGGVFVSDFEVKVEVDNNDTLPFANYTIANNLLDMNTVELPLTTIADACKGQMNEVFAVEGYVTNGTDNENTTFFDTIYIQDETGGMDIFPYATPGLKIGTKMRIVGFLAQYQGDLELKVLSATEIKGDTKVWEPKAVDTKTAMDYANLGGQLLKTTGKVTRVDYNEDGTVAEFWLMDSTGVEAAIFIDGYIRSASTGKNTVGDFVKVGANVTAAGVLYMHPEGASDVSVPVFRVRNCDDITLATDTPSVNPQPQPDNNQSVVEKVVNHIVNVAKTIAKKIEESPVVQAIKKLFFGANETKPAKTTVVAEATEPEESEVEEDALKDAEVVAEASADDSNVEDASETAQSSEASEVVEPANDEGSVPVVPVVAVAGAVGVGAIAIGVHAAIA